MLLISLRLLMTLFFDLIYIIDLTQNDKELEIFILRQQVRILQREIPKTPSSDVELQTRYRSSLAPSFGSS